MNHAAIFRVSHGNQTPPPTPLRESHLRARDRQREEEEDPSEIGPSGAPLFYPPDPPSLLTQQILTLVSLLHNGSVLYCARLAIITQ